MAQHNKQFEPHLLVVQAGTLVDFPNRDPFFHNVFSLFNGKRFDLGLYEAGRDKFGALRSRRRQLSFLQYTSGDERGGRRGGFDLLRRFGRIWRGEHRKRSGGSIRNARVVRAKLA
jgi:hypothetical protein